jgi:hypothetical protein
MDLDGVIPAIVGVGQGYVAIVDRGGWVYRRAASRDVVDRVSGPWGDTGSGRHHFHHSR